MIGSTFIHETDSTRLATLETDLDGLEDMTIVELDSMITLDFEAICTPAEIDWSLGDPVVFNESAGIAVFQVSPDALVHVLGADGAMASEQAEDLEKLRAFVNRHGTSHIYQLATF
jgi:hypothetical protein